jgi:hypothetical protein
MGTHLSHSVNAGQVSENGLIKVSTRGSISIIDPKNFLIVVVDTLVHDFIGYNATPQSIPLGRFSD